MIEWKTLQDLWLENGEKPIDVEIEFPTFNLYHVAAITPKGKFVSWLMSGGEVTLLPKDLRCKLHKPEPVLVAHYQAVCMMHDGQRYITQNVFRSVEEAKSKNVNALRLATELPPIMLEVK